MLSFVSKRNLFEILPWLGQQTIRSRFQEEMSSGS
jgi:hypothetical protein